MTLRGMVIHQDDNVVNLIGPGSKGDVAECSVEGTREAVPVELLDDVPSNHKIAFRDIRSGETIVKYGLSIGKATQDIRRGQYVHIHNVESNRGRGDLK